MGHGRVRRRIESYCACNAAWVFWLAKNVYLDLPVAKQINIVMFKSCAYLLCFNGIEADSYRIRRRHGRLLKRKIIE